MKKLFLLLLVVFVCLMSSAVWAVENCETNPCWVSMNGTQTNLADCEAASKPTEVASNYCDYATGMAAVGSATGTVTVYYVDFGGTYGDMTISNSGTSESNRLVHECYVGETCENDGAGNAIQVSGDYVTVKNFDVTAFPTWGGEYTINITSTADYVILDDVNANDTRTELSMCEIAWAYVCDKTQSQYTQVSMAGDFGTYQNSTIRGSGSTMFGIQQDTEENTIQNCILGPAMHHVISIEECSTVSGGWCNHRILNNTIYESYRSDGLQTNTSPIKGIIIRGNTFYNQGYKGEDALDMKGNPDTNFWLIENNTFKGWPDDDEGYYDDTLGDDICNTSCTNAIANPENWDDWGIAAIIVGGDKTANNVIIRNNIFYDNAGAVEPDSNDNAVGWAIYNNTIIGNNCKGVLCGYSTSGEGIKAFQGDEAWIKNNIIGGHNWKEISIGTNNWGATQPYDWSTSTEPIIEIDGNLYYDSTEELDMSVVDKNNENNWDKYTTLSSWKTDIAYIGSASDGLGNNPDTNAVVGDPDFINVPSDLRPTGAPGTYDFRIGYDSAGRDQGVQLTKTSGSGSGSGPVGVDNADYFFDGWNQSDESADYAKVGDSSCVQISSINYTSTPPTITFVSTIGTWADDEAVYRCISANTPYYGSGPDIGYIENPLDAVPSNLTPSGCTAFANCDTTGTVTLTRNGQANANTDFPHFATNWKICSTGSCATCEAVWDNVDQDANKESEGYSGLAEDGAYILCAQTVVDWNKDSVVDIEEGSTWASQSFSTGAQPSQSVSVISVEIGVGTKNVDLGTGTLNTDLE